MSTAETFPVRFILADIFQLKGLTREDIPITVPVPELTKVQPLVDLRGNTPAIHISSSFHLFDEERQSAKILAAVSSEAGTMIFGSHIGRHE